MTVCAAVGLGSSLGDRRHFLELAAHRFAAHPGLQLLRASRWVRTPPMHGGEARGWFLNGVLLLESALEPRALLDFCRALESGAGRRRTRFWGDRTLDVDLLLSGDAITGGPELELPHPGIASRRFVLEPLIEVWPDAIDPRTGERWAALPPAPGPRPVPVGLLAGRRPALYQGPPTLDPGAHR